MSEYLNVEKPFLEKLKDLGWKVIDHGPYGIPQDPLVSLRNNFKEVLLKDTFTAALKKINKTEQVQTWLNDKQLENLYTEITDQTGKNLHEANKSIFHLLTENTTVDRNELTGEESPVVRFIDFENWKNNSFIAINQFRIKTPGGPRQGIIPDIVLFVNGMPFVVIECKDVDVAEPLSEAEIQIRRYSNRRDDDFGIKEGEERLFHFNLFSIISHGTEARFGSISADFDYYHNWKDIFPEEYKVIKPTTYSNEEEGRYHNTNEKIQPEDRQEIVIHGMLNKEILLDVLQHFALFMEIKEGVEVKVICRYQQYRAVGKILNRLRTGEDNNARSGVIWHTQGSGKSLTMVFLVRKLRSQHDLKDYKILMINDRTDLEKQLNNTARLTGEKVTIISKRKDLRPKLADNSSNLNMVMVHKFLEEEIRHSKALMRAYVEEGTVPEFKPFEVVNASERILLLIDEAHRTQGGDMGDNVFSAFPNAAKIAFTGTPLLTNRHKIKTHERFGGLGTGKPEWIDTYHIKQSVRDRATLDIVYIGKTSKDQIKNKDGMHKEFEDLFKERTEKERQEIQKRYGTMRAYLENMDRLRHIAEDIVEHYTTEIMVNGFKAQVVASSILAAARYEYLIKEALQKKIDKEEAKIGLDKDEEFIKQLKFLEVCTVVTMQDNNEQGFISQARSKAKELNAVESFKKDFNFDKPETGVAIICVCNRLLTGFDAPIEQVMYLDKNLREHDLLQAIARVNRTKGPKKTHGIVVDYFGVANHLKTALAIYGEEDEKELDHFLEYFRDINKEIPVLEARYNRLIQLFTDNGVKQFEAFANQEMDDKKEEFELAEKCVDLAAEIRIRAQFDTYLKAFFDSLDLLFNVQTADKYYIPAKRFAYLLMRIRNRYRDETLDLKWAGEKVRKLIDKYLLSLGIDIKVPPVSLLSDDFPKEVDKNKTGKAKASEMEHAIRRHIKVNMNNDPEKYTRFHERLRILLEKYKGNWDSIVENLDKLRSDIKKEKHDIVDGLDEIEDLFYRNIIQNAFTDYVHDEDAAEDRAEPFVPNEAIIKNIVIEVVTQLKVRAKIPKFWSKSSEVRKLQGEIDDILDFSGMQVFTERHEKICADILRLAETRFNDLKE